MRLRRLRGRGRGCGPGSPTPRAPPSSGRCRPSASTASQRCTSARSFRFALERRRRAGGPGAGRGAVRAPAGQPGHRGRRGRRSTADRSRAPMTAARRGRPLPRHQLRARRGRGGRARSAARPSSSGTATRPLGGVDARGAARRLRPRRLPAPGRDRPLLAGDGRRWPTFAAAGRPGRRDLQRLPGADRGAAAARGAAEEPRACASCARPSTRVASTALGAHRGVRARDGAAHPDQPLRGQLRLRRRDAGRARGRGPDGAALRRQPQRLGRRHRRHLQRGRQRRRPHAPPRAGRSALLGSTDGAVLLRSLLGASAAGAAPPDARRRQPRERAIPACGGPAPAPRRCARCRS